MALVVQNNTHSHAHSLSLSATTSPTEMMKRFQEDVRPLGNSDGMETDADARMVFSVKMAFFLGLAEHSELSRASASPCLSRSTERYTAESSQHRLPLSARLLAAGRCMRACVCVSVGGGKLICTKSPNEAVMASR